MHVRGWTSGRSLTACTKFYCNNVMLQLRLEIYFSHKTNQTYRKCHMHITFDCQQMLCNSLYLLPLQIWIMMMQMCKFMYSMLPSIRTLQFKFPLLIARALKLGPEKIYLVLNMTKDSLTFLLLFPSRN